MQAGQEAEVRAREMGSEAAGLEKIRKRSGGERETSIFAPSKLLRS